MAFFILIKYHLGIHLVFKGLMGCSSCSQSVTSYCTSLLQEKTVSLITIINWRRKCNHLNFSAVFTLVCEISSRVNVGTSLLLKDKTLGLSPILSFSISSRLCGLHISPRCLCLRSLQKGRGGCAHRDEGDSSPISFRQREGRVPPGTSTRIHLRGPCYGRRICSFACKLLPGAIPLLPYTGGTGTLAPD